MTNRDNEIKTLFDYTDSLVLEKIKEVLRVLEKDKDNIKNEMERKGRTNSAFLYSKLIDREFKAIEEIVKYQVSCDLNELSSSLTKDISNKIYLRAKYLAKGKLGILRNTLEKYARFCNKDETEVNSMKKECEDKIIDILDDAKTKIEIHKKKFEIEISKDKKSKISAGIKAFIYILALSILSCIYWKYFSNIFIENPPFNVPFEYEFRLNVLFQLVIIISLLIPFFKKYWYIFVVSDITIILVILSFFR
ncbi:hypothetical protein E3V08_05705 [Candidatus Atribacteria bacterium MT.SAG.1]|nr:hypothetical protein E3V08_05705 [Candidatus Atribacteria bacterium MT.SAG.1]